MLLLFKNYWPCRLRMDIVVHYFILSGFAGTTTGVTLGHQNYLFTNKGPLNYAASYGN